MSQIQFELRRVEVVKNQWGPVFHIQWDDGCTFMYPEQPSCFQTVELAVEWSRQHGHSAKVPEATLKGYGMNWSDAEKQSYWDNLPKLTPDQYHGCTPRIGLVMPQ